LKTPCIKVCVVDPDTGLCRGCFRTLDEIAGWGGFTDEERQQVLDQLKERKQAVAPCEK
jgi:predicted Fe-S protein YdhL (DUF1289 family)